MRRALKLDAQLIAALLASAWLGACDPGDDDAQQQLVPRTCVCCNYADRICEAACDCDPSEACSIAYADGGSQTWASYAVCAAKLSIYCRDSLKPVPVIEVCELALTAAECLETADGPALAAPSVCFD
jgi:hypothetical protein